MAEVTEYRRILTKYGQNTAEVDALVERIVAAEAKRELPALLAQLQTAAEAVDWLLDSDYTAVALQAALPQAGTPENQREMLRFALDRARWCQQCSTAGSEALARGEHVRELEALRSNLR